MPVRRHNAQAILAAPRSESSTAAAPPQSGAHALPSATPAPRIRSSHPPPRSPPHANPLLALLVSLGAAPVRVAHTPAHGHLRELSRSSFPDPGPRPTRPEPEHRTNTHGTPSCTHPSTICRLTHTRPIKRRLIPNPPRPGEPETQSLSLSHPIPPPVTQSRKSSSSHARETPTSVPLPPASRVVFRRVFVVAASRAPTPPTCF